MVPMIVRVYGESGGDDDPLVTDVPVTPDTTCKDIIECCRDPGEEHCALVETWGPGSERVLRDDERPLEILQEWGPHQDRVKFVLRYTVLPSAMNGRRKDTRNGMKEPGQFGESLPDGVELTLGELQEMACRQQHQIDSQHQLLVAKEQRLRFLKQQEARHHQVAAENERLRRLRDRVEAQELKLRKLRALRGQVDENKLNNASLTSDLDSIRALFNEKEKELSLAVAKVEELTRQLEELKRGRGANARDQQQHVPSPAALELEKLRRELMYRNKLNEQQNVRICQQREALSQRQEEMSNIDKRISELQDRLHRKRLLNQQMSNQITAASNKASGQQQLRPAASATTIQQHQYHQQQVQGGKGKLLRPVTSGNIAAVEPYHHVPVNSSGRTVASGDPDKQPDAGGGSYGGQKQPAHSRPTAGDGIAHLGKEGSYHIKHIHQQPDGMSSQEHKHHVTSQDDFHAKLLGVSGVSGGNMNSAPVNNGSATQNSGTKSKEKDDQYLPEFGGSKSDPKYQTLPYNTKFTVNFVSSVTNKLASSDKRDSIPAEDSQRNNNDTNESTMKNNNNNINNINNNNINNPSSQQQLMTVHSTPIPVLSGVSKGLATPLLNQNQQPPHRMDQSMTYQQQSVNKLAPASSVASQMLGHVASRPFGSSHLSYTNTGLSRAQPVGGTSSTTSSTSSLATNSSASSSNSHQKPVSSVAPTSVQHQKPSPIYQTSSTKIHPVQPQTLSSTPQGILRELRGELSPPQSTSTPVSTPEGLPESRQGAGKPALPPKPALPVKPTPPPRQTQHCAPSAINNAELDVGRVDTSADAVDSALSVLKGAPAGLRGGLNHHQEHLLTKLSQQQVPSELDENQPHLRQTSSTTTPPCPPPPTSEPPDDAVSTNIPIQRRFAGVGGTSGSDSVLPVIKARPLTIKKQPPSEHPKLKAVSFAGNGQSVAGGSCNMNGGSTVTLSGVNNNNNNANTGVHVSINRRIEMPPAFLFPENEAPPADLVSSSSTSEMSSATFSSTPSLSLGSGSAASSGTSVGNLNSGVSLDEVDRSVVEPMSGSEVDNNNAATRKVSVGEEDSNQQKQDGSVDTLNNINATLEQQDLIGEHVPQHITVRRVKKGNLKAAASSKVASGGSRRVSFDPLALLLDASLEGELELVRKTAGQVSNPSAANDEGITALHNAICAGHLDIVKFLVEFGCDVNAQDSDGWTPLHCAASCNNLAMVRFLVEHGACIFATTLSDHETAAEKCEEDEEGFDGCSEYLYSVQEKLGILNSGVVYAVYDYEAHNSDELSFKEGDKLIVLRKGDEWEREWWWSRLNDQEGYAPRNLLGLYPRVPAVKKAE